MKKLTLLFALVVILITGANAQVEIKAFVGTNVSGMHVHDFTDFKGSAGYQFGGGVLIGDKFYVEPGIQIGKMTGTITDQTTDLDDFEMKQNFVRIPVYAGYHLLGHENGPLALRIFGGPAVTFPGKLDKELDVFEKDNMSKAIWGIDGGLGVDIFFLFVELNYEHTFTERFLDGTEGKHNSVYINAGIHLDF